MHLPKQNPCYISWSKQQKALTSTWLQRKRSTWAIITLNSGPLKLVDKFTYVGSSDTSENVVNMHLTKASTAIDRLSIVWKSDLSDQIKQNFFRPAFVSVLLNGCTNGRWQDTKRKNCNRILRVILKKNLAKRNNRYTTTYFSSQKSSMQDTAGEAVMFSYGLLHIVVPVLAVQQELINSSVQIQNVNPGYDTKQSDGEVPVLLEIWEYRVLFITITPTLTRSGSTW